jgi:hypothetical protein
MNRFSGQPRLVDIRLVGRSIKPANPKPGAT